MGKKYKVGDIIFDVDFERLDVVPFEKVTEHPTSAELDDYTEFKRLRRAHRDEGERGMHDEAHVRIKLAPQISPTNATFSQLWPSEISLVASPSISHAATFRDPMATLSIISPSPSTLSDSAPDPAILFKESSGGILEVPHVPREPGTLHSRPVPRSTSSGTSLQPPVSSQGSQGRTDVREVTPWLDYDLDLVAAAPSINTRVGRQQEAPASAAFPRRQSIAANARPALYDFHSSSALNAKDQMEAAASDHKPGDRRDRGGQRTSQVRSRNPLAKLFDGPQDTSLDSIVDYFNYKGTRSSSLDGLANSPTVDRHRGVSSPEGVISPLSPSPFRPISPSSPLITIRRNAVCLPSTVSLSTSVRSAYSTDDSFDHMEQMQLRHSRPAYVTSLQNFISAARTASPISAVVSAQGSPSASDCPGPGQKTKPSEALGALLDSDRSTPLDILDGPIVFKNPFVTVSARPKDLSTDSIAPEDSRKRPS